MADARRTIRFRFWLWLIVLIGVIVPRRLRVDWRQEWEAELRYREMLLADWDKLNLPALGMTLIVRGHDSAESLINSLRRAVRSIDPEQPIRRAQLLETAIARWVAPHRLVAALLSLFAGLALLLAMVGIYSVMSYSVAQRTQEIGIRMALGARTNDVLRLVVGQGIKLIAIGLVLGLVGAFAATRVLQSLLFGASATDPATFVGITALLLLVALLACWVPARRATKVDPMIALRCE